MQSLHVWEILSLVSLVVIVLQVAACVLFLSERSPGGWLMLVGSAVLFTVQVFYLLQGAGLWDRIYSNEVPIFGRCGLAIFVAGLLMVALRRRATARRVAELELIVAELEARGR